MRLKSYPNIRKDIDDFLDKYPSAEFGPCHILFSDYNVDDGSLYFCLNKIDEQMDIEQDVRLDHSLYLTDEILLAMREFIKEMLTLQGIVRDVCIIIDTELIYRDSNGFLEGFIKQLLETDIDAWTKEIDFSRLNEYDFDFEYYDFIYNYLDKNMKALIYINRHKVRYNTKNKMDIPCIAIKTYKGVEYVKQADLNGLIIKQDFDNPICSGARIWIEGERGLIKIIE